MLVIFTFHPQVSHACKSPCFQWEQSQSLCSAPAFLQKCPKFRASLTSAVPALTLQPLRALPRSCFEWPFSCSKSERKAQSSLLSYWSGSKRREWRQEQRPSSGQGTSSLCTERQSPLWVQPLPLVAHYKTFFDFIFPKTLYWHSADLLAITTQAIPLGSSQDQPASAQAASMPDADLVFQGPRSWSLRYSLLGLALGFVTRRIIVKKTWKVIINTV